MDFRPSFAGKTALVTGAAQGIGLAAARILAQGGVAKLVLMDLNGDTLAADTADLPGEVIRLSGDVADPGLWAEAESHLADATLFALNAGMATVRPIERFDYSDWRTCVGVNLDGAWLGIQAAFRAMKAKGQGGAITVTGSSAGIKTDAGMSAYGVAKAATHHLVRIAAREGTADRIRVNAVAPGGVATPIWRNYRSFHKRVAELGSEAAVFEEMGREGTPIGKFTSPEEIAGQICFLLSDHCSTVTGEIFLNDGGFTL